MDDGRRSGEGRAVIWGWVAGLGVAVLVAALWSGWLMDWLRGDALRMNLAICGALVLFFLALDSFLERRGYLGDD